MPRVRNGPIPTEPTRFSEVQMDGDGTDNRPGCDSSGIGASKGAKPKQKSANANSMPTPSPSPSTPVQSLPLALPISLPSPEALQASLLSLPSQTRQPRGPQGAQQKRKHISLNHPSHPRTNPAHIPRPRNAFILFRSWALSSGLLSSSSTSSSSSSPSSGTASRVKDKSKGSASRKNSSANASQGSANAPLQQNEASREIAKIWKRVDESTRAVFEEMAREEKRRHREMYPGYRYAPRKVQLQQQLQQQRQQRSEDRDYQPRRNGGGGVSRMGRVKPATRKATRKGQRKARAMLTPETTPEPSSPSPSPSPSPEPEREAGSEGDEDGLSRGRRTNIDPIVDASMDVDEVQGASDDDENSGDDDGDGAYSPNRAKSQTKSSSKAKSKSESPATRTQPEFTYPSPSSPRLPPALFSSFRSPPKSSPILARADAKAETATNAADVTANANTPFSGKPTWTRKTINEAYVPLLASTTYYAPTFIHVDRTCRVSSANANANNASPDRLSQHPSLHSGDERHLDQHNPDGEDLNYDFDFYPYSFTNATNVITGSVLRVEEDETGYIRIKEEEDEQALILRAVKPYAPLWGPAAHLTTTTMTRPHPASGSKELEVETVVGSGMMDFDML